MFLEIFQENQHKYATQLAATQLKLQIPEDLTIQSDLQLLKTVFHNLIENSIQFADYRRSIPLLIIQTETSEYDDNLHLYIKDNGMGIPKEIQSKIYDMFFVGMEGSKGEGLGLYEAKLILDKLHGKIQLEDDPNFTSFHIEIPSKPKVL